MVYKSDPEAEASLEKRWQQMRDDLVAEHYGVIQYFPKKEAMRLGIVSIEDNNKLYIEFPEGMPMLTVRNNGGWKLLGAIGPEGKSGIDDYDNVRLDGPKRYEYISKVLSKRDQIVQGVENFVRPFRDRMVSELNFEKRVFDDLKLDDSTVDRGEFYLCMAGKAPRDVFNVKEKLLAGARDHFTRGVQKWTPEWDRAMEMLAVAEEVVDERFSVRNRLAGHLDWRLVNLAQAAGESNPEMVAKVAEWAGKEPSMAAMRGKGVSDWVKETCTAHNIDYGKIPDSLKFAEKLDKKLVFTQKR